MNARRDFVKTALATSSGLAGGTCFPQSWLSCLANEARKSDRVLVVIQLSGGNDGLNTIVPFVHDEYRKRRPKLAIDKSDVLKIDAELGFHPSMRGAAELLDASQLSIVQGVGYPKPNRSHFESMDIWHSCATKENRTETGWIGRMLDSRDLLAGAESPALHLGSEQQPRALASRNHAVPSVDSIEQFRLRIVERIGNAEALAPKNLGSTEQPSSLLDFLQINTSAAMAASDRLSRVLQSPDKGNDFPRSALAEKLKIVARLISAGLQTRVYYVELNGFDTHAQQLAAHAALLSQWSDALRAFMKSLEAGGHAERTLVLTFSEFGRRLAENASMGTDHGAAAPVFLTGPAVRTAVVGATPSLTDLDDGDLKYHTDFRSIYASIIEKWFGIPSAGILGGDYPLVDLFHAKYHARG